ncbi:MAG: IclR family transcriptional regulator [Novosphingobium sp.]
MTDHQLTRTVKDSKAPAISRAAAILRLLGKSETPLGLNPIARELGINPSTCLYVLRALVAEELVSFDADTKRYALEAGVLTLARQWLQRNQVPDLAQPLLDRLAQQFGVTVLVVQIVGLDHIIAVAVAQAGGFQLSVQVGSRFPALISATGRCIAAFGDYPQDKIAARFARLRWEDPPRFEDWLEQVAQARTQGFGIDEGNYISGVTVLAAPIWKAHGAKRNLAPSHAIVAIGIGSAMKAKLDELQPALLDAARTLTLQLGGESPPPP